MTDSKWIRQHVKRVAVELCGDFERLKKSIFSGQTAYCLEYPQFTIFQKALGTLPEDGNVMP
jgi:hypothetical protein